MPSNTKIMSGLLLVTFCMSVCKVITKYLNTVLLLCLVNYFVRRFSPTIWNGLRLQFRTSRKYLSLPYVLHSYRECFVL